MLGSKKIFIGLILSGVLVGCSSNNEPPKTKEQLAAEQKEKDKEKIEKLIKSVNLQVSEDTPIERVKIVVDALDNIDGDIKESQFFNNKVLNIRLKPVSTNDYLTLIHTSESAEKVINVLKKKGITDLQTFIVAQDVTLVDKYKNQTESELYTIDYDYPELVKVNTENGTNFWDYLRFAKFTPNNHFGLETFNNFCNEGGTRDLVEPFCDGIK